MVISFNRGGIAERANTLGIRKTKQPDKLKITEEFEILVFKNRGGC